MNVSPEALVVGIVAAAILCTLYAVWEEKQKPARMKEQMRESMRRTRIWQKIAEEVRAEEAAGLQEAEEKPKRKRKLVLGDDGEALEIIEEEDGHSTD